MPTDLPKIPITLPKSDLSRSIQHEASQDWPESVKLQLLWRGRDGRPLVRTEVVSADQFFGHGQYGAPMDGNFLVQAIERMRRKGPPTVTRKLRKS